MLAIPLPLNVVDELTVVDEPELSERQLRVGAHGAAISQTRHLT